MTFVSVIVYCEGPSLEGGLEKGPESFRGGAEILATAPGAFNCEGSVFSYSWQMNGCGFEFDPGYGSGGSFEGEFDIGPPGCGPIALNAGLCPIEIPPQIGRPVSFENAGEGSGKTVRADIEIDLLRYKSLGGPLCPASEEYGGSSGERGSSRQRTRAATRPASRSAACSKWGRT